MPPFDMFDDEYEDPFDLEDDPETQLVDKWLAEQSFDLPDLPEMPDYFNDRP